MNEQIQNAENRYLLAFESAEESCNQLFETRKKSSNLLKQATLLVSDESLPEEYSNRFAEIERKRKKYETVTKPNKKVFDKTKSGKASAKEFSNRLESGKGKGKGYGQGKGKKLSNTGKSILQGAAKAVPPGSLTAAAGAGFKKAGSALKGAKGTQAAGASKLLSLSGLAGLGIAGATFLMMAGKTDPVILEMTKAEKELKEFKRKTDLLNLKTEEIADIVKSDVDAAESLKGKKCCDFSDEEKKLFEKTIADCEELSSYLSKAIKK